MQKHFDKAQCKQKGISSIIFIIIIIALLAVAGFFAYQYFASKTNNQAQVQSNQQNQNQQQQTVNQQTNNVQPVNQIAKPSVVVISPNGGETWQMGALQAVKYSYNKGGAGTCVDVFAVNPNGEKFSLGGQGVSMDDYIFSLKPGSIQYDKLNNVPADRYKIELDVHYCAETNNAFIASDTSDNYFTVTK